MFFFWGGGGALQPNLGHGLLILEVSRSHTTTHNRQTSMFPVGFEPTISAGERPQFYALDRAATGTGNYTMYLHLLHTQHVSAIYLGHLQGVTA